MGGDMEREVAARLKFDLAEASILNSHLVALIDEANTLRSAIGGDNGKQAMDSWNAMSDHMNYIGTLLNLKGSTAARQYIAEHGIEGV